MYKLRNKKLRKELLNGRTITYVANKIGVTISFLSTVLQGKKTCRKHIALILVSIGKNISITDEKTEQYLEYYFEERR